MTNYIKQIDELKLLEVGVNPASVQAKKLHNKALEKCKPILEAAVRAERLTFATILNNLVSEPTRGISKKLREYRDNYLQALNTKDYEWHLNN